jgi:hypothetical protein
MTVSSEAYLKGVFDSTTALGDKIVSSDAMFVIEGYENLSILCKQFPWPVLTPQGEIEVPGPSGTKTFQPQQINTAMQGPVSFFETKEGAVQKMIREINANGGRFDARVYEGTVENHSSSARIKQAFFQMDSPDRDFENRAQLLMITGTLFYHYHGEA